MKVLADNVRAVFWIAAIPAAIAVIALIAGVEEPAPHADHRSRATAVHWRDMWAMDRRFWWVVILGAVFTLARFSEAFLIVYANDRGLSLGWLPVALAIMNLTYVITAYPIGKLSDRIGREGLLLVGIMVLIAADIVLIWAPNLNVVLVGIAIWGLHLGITQGLFSALVADTAPPELRGSAFGIFNFASGIAAVAASIVAGLLWQQFGSAYTFGTGAAFAFVTMGCLAWQHWQQQIPRKSGEG
jgi:MFS family permease